MPRDSSVYLDDIVTATERIVTYVAGHTWESFIVDAKTVDAVVRNLEIVGEAVKKVPAEVRQQAPAIDDAFLRQAAGKNNEHRRASQSNPWFHVRPPSWGSRGEVHTMAGGWAGCLETCR